MSLIRIGGLSLFSRTNSRGHWILAAYHSPQSLTWSWCLSFSMFRADEWRVWPIWMPYRTNNGLQWTVRIPWIGFLRWSRQRPMWYRDLYRRMRDEQDRLSGQIVDRQRPEPPRIIHPQPSRMQ